MHIERIHKMLECLAENPYVRLKKGLRMSIQKKWEK